MYKISTNSRVTTTVYFGLIESKFRAMVIHAVLSYITPAIGSLKMVSRKVNPVGVEEVQKPEN